MRGHAPCMLARNGHGKQERVTLGRHPALSLKLARPERDKRATMVAQGQSPAVQKRLEKQGAAPDTIEQLMTTGQVVMGRFKQVAMDDRRVQLAR